MRKFHLGSFKVAEKSEGYREHGRFEAASMQLAAGARQRCEVQVL